MASNRKTKSGKHQLDLYDELHEFLDEVDKSVFKSKEEALDKAAEYFLNEVTMDSPVGLRETQNTGKLKESWEQKHLLASHLIPFILLNQRTGKLGVL